MLGGFCPGGFVRGVLFGGVLSKGVLSGGVLSRGFCPRGVLVGGFCPGGFCLGGFCPRIVAIPVTSMGGKRVSTCVPGWTAEHSLARDRSTFWHHLWISNDKPEHDWIASIMKSTRTQYHYLIRKLKRSRDSQIRGAFGEPFLEDRLTIAITGRRFGS